MKQFPDGNNNFPLVEKSSSSGGSPPTAENFNGVTAELVNIVKVVGFPLDPLSGESNGSDNKPLMESESNKQLTRAIKNLDQQTYLKGLEDNNNIMQHVLGMGIVKGLTVSKTDTLKVSIAEGLGYDSLGQQILVSSPIEIDLNSEASATEKTIQLGLEYTIVPADYVIGAESPHYKNTITITPVFASELDSTTLLLATITIDHTGIITINAEDNFTTLQKQIQNTSSLSTTTEQASLQSQLLSLLSNNINITSQESMILDSPLINLITQNLQINGTPYMEIGENDNGHYVKFESGLLICIGGNQQILQGDGYLNYSYPHSFKNILYAGSFIVMKMGGNSVKLRYYTNTDHVYVRSFPIYNVSNISCTSVYFSSHVRPEFNGIVKYLILGMWK